MKEAQFIKDALAGRPLIVVEYRATETDTIRRKVVKAGEASTMPIIKHKVLSGNDSFEVAEFLPDGSNLSEVKPPFAFRDLVVFEVDSREVTKYGSRMTGTFHGKLEK